MLSLLKKNTGPRTCINLFTVMQIELLEEVILLKEHLLEIGLELFFVAKFKLKKFIHLFCMYTVF